MRLWLVPALFLGALPLSAQTIEVFYPRGASGPEAGLRDALLSAPAGATIVVHGGVWQPITITRAVTVIGAPQATIDVTDPMLTTLLPAIELDGPGSGIVRLANLATTGTAVGFVQSRSAPAIQGGGFDELHVQDSELAPPQWCCLTGLGTGPAGIDTSVPYVVLERTHVRGARTDTDDSFTLVGFDGGDAVHAPASTVVVLDSELTGGDAGTYRSPNSACDFGCPGGLGGLAIEAAGLIRSDSTFAPGAGATWINANYEFCCQVPNGPTFAVGTNKVLFNALDALGPAQLGRTLELRLASSGTAAQLWMDVGVKPPVLVPGLGVRFFDPATAVNLGSHATPGTAIVPIPNSVALIGSELCFQLLDPSDGYTRPVVSVVVPGKAKAR